MQISLNAEESAVLREALTSYVSDLRMEIADTDSMDYRRQLMAKEGVLNRLLAQIDGSATA